jgi:hypothetical protein
MSLTPEQFEQWYETISQDDIDYALDLIKRARAELTEQVANLHDDVVELTEARTVLEKFTLRGIN